MATQQQEPVLRGALAARREPASRAAPGADRSITELLGDLADDVGRLVRQEVKLASTEMTRKAEFAARQAIYVAVGLLLGVVALLCLIAALVLGLATTMAL